MRPVKPGTGEPNVRAEVGDARCSTEGFKQAPDLVRLFVETLIEDLVQVEHVRRAVPYVDQKTAATKSVAAERMPARDLIERKTERLANRATSEERRNETLDSRQLEEPPEDRQARRIPAVAH
jgi:hypothetical protein